MTLTHYGIREWGTAGVAAVVVIALAWIFLGGKCPVCAWIITAVAALLFFCIAAFFRNPVRKIPADPTLLLSPADGTIRDIEVVTDFEQAPFKGEALRIGIFLSVFNVHVNRACADLKVESKIYRPGEYLDARHVDCKKRNEAMTIAGTAELAGVEFPLAIRQISGAIARRIVCPVQVESFIPRGQIYGMIKFGSRTEIYIPKDMFELKIKIGDKVSAGTSIIAELKK